MTEDQIKHMVDRFLMWKLPEHFNPDGGISFKKTFNEHTAFPAKHEPSGTNLLSAVQATEMVRYMVEGLTALSANSAEHHLGWLYTNPDAGNEWSEQHPRESGECEDAADVFPATLENLKNELICAWQELNAARDEASPPAPAQGDAEAVAWRATSPTGYVHVSKHPLGRDAYKKAGWEVEPLYASPSPAPEAEKLREALKLMLAHSCVADAGPDMKSEEDHAAERAARAALKEKAP